MTILTTEPPCLVSQSSIAPLRLKDIVRTLPRECFQRDRRKAWFQVITNVLLVGLGYWGLAIAPWYCLPVLWIFVGTGLTGFFVIGHDCGHRSFAKRRWVNDLVGHLFMLPLIYPFHSWRLKHDQHHQHTNKMDVDNAWQPFRPETYDAAPGWLRVIYHLMRGQLWWLASIAHWATVHFDLSSYKPSDRPKAQFSNRVVIVFALVALPLLIATTGWWGFVKFWLMPWLGYHFWMSTFTLVHHTLPEIPFRDPAEWNEAEAQLFGTVHCEYPAWVEFLCHHINVHIPHHLSVAIPSYNLRLAHRHLQQTWGDRLLERRFSWQLMKTITEQCHIYHPELAYQSFQDYRQAKPVQD